MHFAPSWINQVRGGHAGSRAADRIAAAIRRLAEEYVAEMREMGNAPEVAAMLLKEAIDEAAELHNKE